METFEMKQKWTAVVQVKENKPFTCNMFLYDFDLDKCTCSPCDPAYTNVCKIQNLQIE